MNAFTPNPFGDSSDFNSFSTQDEMELPQVKNRSFLDKFVDGLKARNS
jgi:hypothetical protein